MRELKFQTWDKKVKGWGFPIHLNDEAEGILLQSTGLKDKNGKEIYEGDILGNKYPHEDGNFYRFVITWSQLQCKFYGHHICHCSSDFYGNLDPSRWGLYRVIGNIYENPKMLNRGIKD